MCAATADCTAKIDTVFENLAAKLALMEHKSYDGLNKDARAVARLFLNNP
jgi:hypothetical protein